MELHELASIELCCETFSCRQLLQHFCIQYFRQEFVEFVVGRLTHWNGQGSTLGPEQFRPYIWGAPPEPIMVGPARLKCTGCHTIQAKLDGLKKREGWHIQPCRYSSYLPLWPLAFPPLHFKRRALIGWPVQLTVWNIACCIWNGQVETGALSRFNRTVMLIHAPFGIRFLRPSSTIRPKRKRKK